MRLSMRAALVVLLVLGLAATAQAGFGVILPRGPDPMVKRWPHWPYQTICGETPFDPVAAFSGETLAENGAGEPEAALRGFLAETLDTGLPERFWRPVTLTDSRAEFASGRLKTVPYLLTFNRVGEKWTWVRAGSCRPRSLREGITAAEWRLDEERAPSPSSRTIVLRVDERVCTGGANPNPRVQAPGLDFRKDRLIVTLFIEPLPPGVYSCVRRTSPPYRLRLPRPLGDRSIWNGATYPPREELRASP